MPAPLALVLAMALACRSTANAVLGLLGFQQPIGIAMRDANSRRVRTSALDAHGATINDISRFAADMVFFTSAEAGFFAIGAGFYRIVDHAAKKNLGYSS